ncbi:MAG: hypothetical protein HY303_16775, partial [Candidatus Wallbacteria bacterium]|nr:hypothetical protein [Candidatus Wallbacteria bacterium]
LAICWAVWALRWQIWTVGIEAARPPHTPITAEEWWTRALAAGAFDAALLDVQDVAASQRERLVDRSAKLDPKRGAALLWQLVVAGHEAALPPLERLLRSKTPAAARALLPTIDLAGVCRDRKPRSAHDRALKLAAAKLWLACADPSSGCLSASGPPTPDALTRLACLAATDSLPPDCAAAIRAGLDNPSWPPAARAQAALVCGLSGIEGCRLLLQRLTGHRDSSVRVWAARGLVCGGLTPEIRVAASAALESQLTAGTATDSELTREALRDLQPSPAAGERP